MRHPKIPLDILARAAPFLMADDHDPAAFQRSNAADDGHVIPIPPIAMQLDKAVDHALDEVERMGPIAVTGQLHALPGGQSREHVGGACVELELQQLQLPQYIGGGIQVAFGFKLGDAAAKVVKVALEFKHRVSR